jgi:hypothetical protein
MATFSIASNKIGFEGAEAMMKAIAQSKYTKSVLLALIRLTLYFLLDPWSMLIYLRTALLAHCHT